MHPKKSALCSICFVLLAFLFLPTVSSTETLSDKIKHFVQGEADTLYSFNAGPRNFVYFNAGYSLIVREKDSLKRGSHPRLTLIDFHGEVIWDTVLRWGNTYQLTSDQWGSPKVIIGHYLGEGAGVETEIFNSRGIRLAKVKDETNLGNSPGGIYFHNFQTLIEMNRFLDVYDSLGNLIWTKESNAWQPFPLSDSLLLYFTLDKLLVLEAKSGEIRKDFSDEIENKSSVFAYLAASRDGRFFSIYGGTAHDTILTSFSVDTGLLWSLHFNISKEWMEEPNLSPDGRFLGVMRRQRDKPKHWEIQFRDNFAQGKLVWKFEFEVERALTASSWKTVAIFDSFLVTAIPSGYDYYVKGLNSNTRTKCVFYDPINGSVTDSFTVKGFLTQINSRKFDTRYFRAVYDEGYRKILILRNR